MFSFKLLLVALFLCMHSKLINSAAKFMKLKLAKKNPSGISQKKIGKLHGTYKNLGDIV